MPTYGYTTRKTRYFVASAVMEDGGCYMAATIADSSRQAFIQVAREYKGLNIKNFREVDEANGDDMEYYGFRSPRTRPAKPYHPSVLDLY